MSGLSYVYRARDRHGNLLYVGCSTNPHQRLGAHRHAQAPWLPFLDHLEIDGPWERSLALDLEGAAIASERPWFNITPEETRRVQANRVAATRLMDAAGDGERDAAWYDRRSRVQRAIRDEYPFESTDERVSRYLAGRTTQTPAELLDRGSP